MCVERHTGRNHEAIKSGEIDLKWISQIAASLKRGARHVLPIPRGHFSPACQQALYRRRAGPREPEYRVAFSSKGGGRNHRSFSVATPARASTMAMLQKRITTLLSLQPSCSIW